MEDGCNRVVEIDPLAYPIHLLIKYVNVLYKRAGYISERDTKFLVRRVLLPLPLIARFSYN